MTHIVKNKSVIREQVPGLASIMTMSVTGPKLEEDWVAAISCEGCPDIAKDFFKETGKKSKRPWMTKKVKSRILMAGFHIIPKCRRFKGNPEIEWRISFSAAENIIVSIWSRYERTLYALFKCIFKRHIGMNKVITSYHLKTIVFWMFDKKPWGKNVFENPLRNLKFMPSLILLLDTLLHQISEGYIPLYFVPKINLLYGIPGETLAACAKKLSIFRMSLNQQDTPDHLGLYMSLRKDMQHIGCGEIIQNALLHLTHIRHLHLFSTREVIYSFAQYAERRPSLLGYSENRDTALGPPTQALNRIWNSDCIFLRYELSYDREGHGNIDIWSTNF